MLFVYKDTYWSLRALLRAHGSFLGTSPFLWLGVGVGVASSDTQYIGGVARIKG